VVRNAETPQIAPARSAEAQTSFNLTQNRCFVSPTPRKGELTTRGTKGTRKGPRRSRFFCLLRNVPSYSAMNLIAPPLPVCADGRVPRVNDTSATGR
jgi:hypothetical protein